MMGRGNRQPNVILDGTIVGTLQNTLVGLFETSRVEIPPEAPQGTVVFLGQLTHTNSEAIYDQLAARWLLHTYTPMLKMRGPDVELTAVPGLIKPKPSNPWINLALFVVTVISVVAVGIMSADDIFYPETIDKIIAGLLFAGAFLSILGAHEFGHYFAAKYHRVAVTLPYFIPFPTLWGTMGAFIQLRSPTRNRNQLFDVGVAGPLAGLAVTVPVLFIGLWLSPLISAAELAEMFPGQPILSEGNSIFYWLAKYLTKGQALPSADGLDVFLHPLAWAGWSGLFVTVLNLIPVGQLDGGHVAFVLFGERVKYAGYIFVGVMVLLGTFLWNGWFFLAFMLLFFLGIGHPPPLNDLHPVSLRRKWLGYAVLVILILLFVPNPLVISPLP